MELLNSIYLMDYKAQLPKPVQGTCSWILNDPAFLNWKNNEESNFLWVTGGPGCGKTMISAYLTDQLKLDNDTHAKPQVLFFFCDDKIKDQRDAKSILRGIIWQIVRLHRNLLKYVRQCFDQEGPSLATSFSALWELFLKIVSKSTFGSVRIIVDALDECEMGSRNRFIVRNSVSRGVARATYSRVSLSAAS
jgi:Cdc6-like AAA superfamily ATPase